MQKLPWSAPKTSQKSSPSKEVPRVRPPRPEKSKSRDISTIMTRNREGSQEIPEREQKGSSQTKLTLLKHKEKLETIPGNNSNARRQVSDSNFNLQLPEKERVVTIESQEENSRKCMIL